MSGGFSAPAGEAAPQDLLPGALGRDTRIAYTAYAVRWSGQNSRPNVSAYPSTSTVGVKLMSKGMDRKKENKKKPAKTIKEKRAEKRAKKESRGF